MKLIPNDCTKSIFQILLLSCYAVSLISSSNSKATVNISNLLLAGQNQQATIDNQVQNNNKNNNNNDQVQKITSRSTGSDNNNNINNKIILNNNKVDTAKINQSKTVDGIDIKNELPKRFQEDFGERDKIVDVLYQPKTTVDNDSKNKQKSILLLFKGAITHHTKRQALRKFYQTEVNPHFKDYNIQVKFLVGTDVKDFNNLQSSSNNDDNNNNNIRKTLISTLDTEILKEAKSFNDMIIGDFEDTYENLVLKSLLGLQWFTSLEEKSRPEYLLLIDDDVSVKINDLVRLLRNKEEENSKKTSRNLLIESSPENEKDPMLLCPWKNARRARVSRRGPWAVPIKTYPTNFWPSYCGGACYLLNYSAASKLHDAAKSAVAFDVNVEDAFVTGVLRVRAGFELESTRPICQHNLSKDSVTGQFLENRKNGNVQDNVGQVHMDIQKMK